MSVRQWLYGLGSVGAVFVLQPGVPAWAQLIEINPPSIEIAPPGELRRRPPPPPPIRGVRPDRFEVLRQQMAEYRAGCEDGDRRACVRLGIIIGENRERRAQWRRDNPELFFWEREGR